MQNQQDPHNIIPFPGHQMPEKEPVPHIRCTEPDCGLPLRFDRLLPTTIQYRCDNGHIREIARPDGKQVPIRWIGGPDDAA